MMENTPKLGENTEFDELEAELGRMFGGDDLEEPVMLTQNLEGFASCFPDWDLHPPKRR